MRDLQALVAHPGWKFLVEKVIDLNIRMLRRDLENDESLSKEENDIKKRDLRFLRNLKRIPEFQIDVLLGKNPVLEEYDPYFTDIKDLEREIGATVVSVQAPEEKKGS